MKTKIFVLLLGLCLLLSIGAMSAYAIEARDGEVGDDNGVVTTAEGGVTSTDAAALTTTGLPHTTAPIAPHTTAATVTTAPVTTAMPDTAGEGGSALAIILAILAAVAIVILVVVLVPKMRR